jgi:ABC-type maltose transport system permease subunit
MFFATIILTLLPIILIFCLFSKTIMENTSVGGLKG